MDDSHVSWLGTFVSALGATMSINEVQALISIIVTIIGFLITLTTSVIIPLIKNIKNAKKDGKITNKELDKISDDLKKGLKEIKGEDKDER